MHEPACCSGGFAAGAARFPCATRPSSASRILDTTQIRRLIAFSSAVDVTPFSSPRVFLAIRSMSAIGIICHWSLAPPAATRFPSSIIIAVIVLPHRGEFRRGTLMRNTCSK